MIHVGEPGTGGAPGWGSQPGWREPAVQCAGRQRCWRCQLRMIFCRAATGVGRLPQKGGSVLPAITRQVPRQRSGYWTTERVPRVPKYFHLAAALISWCRQRLCGGAHKQKFAIGRRCVSNSCVVRLRTATQIIEHAGLQDFSGFDHSDN